MAVQRKINLDPLIQGEFDVELKRSESPEERTVRLKREESETTLQLWKEKWLFIIGVTVVLVVGSLCLWAIFDQSFSSDQQKWAMTLISSMITGVVGYLYGKASK